MSTLVLKQARVDAVQAYSKALTDSVDLVTQIHHYVRAHDTIQCVPVHSYDGGKFMQVVPHILNWAKGHDLMEMFTLHAVSKSEMHSLYVNSDNTFQISAQLFGTPTIELPTRKRAVAEVQSVAAALLYLNKASGITREFKSSLGDLLTAPEAGDAAHPDPLAAHPLPLLQAVSTLEPIDSAFRLPFQPARRAYVCLESEVAAFAAHYARRRPQMANEVIARLGEATLVLGITSYLLPLLGFTDANELFGYAQAAKERSRTCDRTGLDAGEEGDQDDPGAGDGDGAEGEYDDLADVPDAWRIQTEQAQVEPTEERSTLQVALHLLEEAMEGGGHWYDDLSGWRMRPRVFAHDVSTHKHIHCGILADIE